MAQKEAPAPARLSGTRTLFDRNTIISPTQARDKDEETLKKERCVFCLCLQALCLDPDDKLRVRENGHFEPSIYT